jgi:5-methylcytosine-specific restriction endonuclease McrA
MSAFKLTHLSDDMLLRELVALVACERLTTATLLAHLAEVDCRRLYLGIGYTSMHVYCVVGLGLSDDAAAKRIQAARAAYRHPRLFEDLAAGRLHLTAINLLSPFLTAENVGELVAAAARKRRPEIELFLAQRFPAAPGTVPRAATLRPVVVRPRPQHAPEHVDEPNGQFLFTSAEPGPESPASMPGPETSPARFELRVTIDEGTRSMLHRAQSLLGHAVPAGDVAQVLERALAALLEQLEKRKWAATPRLQVAAPRRVDRPTRTIPAHVRREVWRRDRGRCSFVGPDGTRCETTGRLEFDHVVPVARGGTATVDGIRLRCRPHNQLEAERALGAEFMARKRAEAHAAESPP